MSVAIVPMSQQFGYSDTTKGLIASAFSWGYMVFMIPAGNDCIIHATNVA
jgi:MFS transporter, ACS family, solute carrier family 17 (sodium-dependent inorganic phosphate cotransporter), other